MMFGDVGKKLIGYMGHSGTIPSAIDAEHVSSALCNLQTALESQSEPSSSEKNSNDDEQRVSLRKRAIPLIELLQSAEKNNDGVMWDVAYG